MKNVIEMLRAEHVAIKQHVKGIDSSNMYDQFLKLKDFLFKVHSMTEDLIFFPRIVSYRRMPEDIIVMVRRLEADHKLLDKLATNIVDWHANGREKLVEDRLKLFFETLLEHNRLEESEIFSRSEVLEYPESLEADTEIWDVVKKYGVSRYEDYVGVSDEYLSSTLRLRTPFVK